MTPKEFHDICHEACCDCPQFVPYDDDQEFQGWGDFGDIPKQGWLKVIKFWKQERILWEMGYSEALPEEVLELFERIDTLLNEAIFKAVGEMK